MVSLVENQRSCPASIANEKQLRAKLAKEAGIPAYVVFSNATLNDMAQKQPQNMSQFKKVSGVGELKAAWYGNAFLEEIQRYQKDSVNV